MRWARQWLRRLAPGRVLAAVWRRGLAGGASLLLALLVCYGGLAALAVVVSSRRHRSATIPLPAIAGAGMVGYVLFVDYHMIIELSGFGLLALAVWLDCRRRRRSESRVPGLETHG